MYTFADHVGGAVPASQLDANFAALQSFLLNSPLWYGGVGDGTTDDTAAWAAALAAGGIISGVGKSWSVTNITASLANTVIRDATLVGRAAATGALLTVALAATGTRIENVKLDCTASAYTQGILHRSDYLTTRDLTINGVEWDWLAPYSSFTTTCTPQQGILCRKADNSPQFGLDMENTEIIGGVVAVALYNQEGNGQARNTKITGTLASGLAFTGGVASRGFLVENLYATGCGQYGLAYASQSGAGLTTWPIPYDNLRILNCFAENCGWNTYLTGINGGVGGGKGGFDITGGSENGVTFLGNRARNCTQLGMEYKGALPLVTFYPSGRRHAHIEVDVETSIDNVGAYLLCDENDVAASSYFSDTVARVNCWWHAPTLWKAGLWYKKGDPVSDGAGFTWIAMQDGFAGATIPTGGHAPATVTSSGALTSGTATFTTAATGAVAVGDIAFIEESAAVEGLTVQSRVVNTSITFNGNASATVASSSTYIFHALHNDGTVKWFCLEATPTNGAIACDVRASTNLSLTVNAFNTSIGTYVNAIDSTTGNIVGLKLNGTTSDCVTGVRFDGTGTIDCTMLMPVEALDATVPISIDSGTVVSIKRPRAVAAPISKTANFTVGTAEDGPFLCNKVGSDCTVTMPTASEWPGRRIPFVNYSTSFSVVSNASNVIAIDGTGPSTAMLAPGMSGAVQSDGSNWVAVP